MSSIADRIDRDNAIARELERDGVEPAVRVAPRAPNGMAIGGRVVATADGGLGAGHGFGGGIVAMRVA